MTQQAQSGRSDAYALALETSSLWGSAALGRAGQVRAEQCLERPRKHASDLLPVVDRLCRDAGLEPAELGEVYVSIGPGSFTGLRVGVTVARMLALAHGARLVAVPTLTVIAQNGLEADDPPDRLVVITDAKRRRVYAATFERQADRYVPTTEPAEHDPARLFAAQPHTCAILGDGVTEHQAAVELAGLRVLPESLFRPRARTVYHLGCDLAQRESYTNPRDLIPHYVRRVEAEERWEQKHGSEA